jgi:Ca2+-binding RTX toxin-like protein
VILGGEGDDLLVGGSNRDLLIGGLGADRIVGNEQDDILVAGYTAFDAVDSALAVILAEWTSARSYSTRVSNLMGAGTGPRANGSTFLITDGAAATVFDDGVADVLTGDTGLDWFLFNVDGDGDAKKKDKVTDLTAQEFASDLDFITGP